MRQTSTASTHAERALKALSMRAGVAAARDLDLTLDEYWQFAVRGEGDVIWLTGRIQPVPRLAEGAALRISLPLDPSLPVRIWAWWDSGIWIGPRHTNADGSACVFEANDPIGTWNRTFPLVQLLDMTSAWVLRQLHLQEHGRWPGPQHLHTAFERMEIHQPGELCGCGSMATYESCHAVKDAALGEDAIRHELHGLPLSVARKALYGRRVPIGASEFLRAALEPLQTSTLAMGLRRLVKT